MAAFLQSLTALFLLATLASAHSISVSVGEGKIEGDTLTLSLRIPRYEAEHLGQAQAAAAFRFRDATITAQACAFEADEFRCQFTYRFSQPVGERLEAEVQLARVTVPNHVHILHLSRAGVQRQAIFDRAFERDTLDFHQSSMAETASRGARLGAAQLLFQPVVLVLLATIGLLKRPWVYLAASAVSFLAVLPDRFYATPGFFELAGAVAIAYLAIERLAFPDAAPHWLAFALIGAIEGAGLAVLARPTAAAALSFGAGNLLLQAFLSLLAWQLARGWGKRWWRGTFAALAAFGILESLWIYVKRF